MKRIELKAHAKLNLSLNILPERGERGFFKVDFLNTSISLHDTVRIIKKNNSSLSVDVTDIEGKTNIALEALLMMCETFHLPGGLSVDILKNVPLRAGLGGGSADAAAVIRGINAIYELELDTAQLLSIAKKIGMDVCYCVIGGLCRISGVGEIVQRLPFHVPDLNLLVATPRIKKPSTAWAYSIIDKSSIGKKRSYLPQLLAGIEDLDIEKIARFLHNDFEEPVCAHFPIIEQIKECMIKNGALRVMLAGSGLSVFGIFINQRERIRAKKAVESSYADCFCTQLINSTS